MTSIRFFKTEDAQKWAAMETKGKINDTNQRRLNAWRKITAHYPCVTSIEQWGKNDFRIGKWVWPNNGTTVIRYFYDSTEPHNDILLASLLTKNPNLCGILTHVIVLLYRLTGDFKFVQFKITLDDILVILELEDEKIFNQFVLQMPIHEQVSYAFNYRESPKSFIVNQRQLEHTESQLARFRETFRIRKPHPDGIADKAMCDALKSVIEELAQDVQKYRLEKALIQKIYDSDFPIFPK